MALLPVAVGVALLLALVLWARLDAFFALLVTAAAVGLLAGLGPLAVLDAVLRGMGGTLGGVLLVLVFGAMLGKLLEESGAAQVLVDRLARLFGPRRLPLALGLAGLLVGLPMLYNAGFLVLVPLVTALAARTGLPLAALGVATAAALSAAHGFLPPHPAPTFVAAAYGAPLGTTLLAGLAAAVPAGLVGGAGFARVLRAAAASGRGPWAGAARVRPPALGPAFGTAAGPGDVPNAPGAAPAAPNATPPAPPGLAASLAVVLLPVLSVLAGAAVDLAAGTGALDPLGAGAAQFPARLAALVPDPRARAAVAAGKLFGNAAVALLLGLLLALWALGLRRGRRMDDLMASTARAAGGVAGLVLVIGAGGAFAQVLRDAGLADAVARQALALGWPPLLLAFAVAAALRAAVGSATVAALTTAGLLAPLARAGAEAGGARPELLVVATGAGSLMFSHVNDTGFWMFKQYFHLSVRQTLATWSVMEAAVALTGLLAVCALGLVW